MKPDDAQRALEVLLGIGMRREDPPEDWLLKAWDGEVLIDLIFAPLGLEIDDDLFESADRMNVFSIHMPVMRLEDVFATKLMSLNDHYLDYAGVLKLVRAVREQVDWDEVRGRTRSSPYARAFFALLARARHRDHRGARCRDRSRATRHSASFPGSYGRSTSGDSRGSEIRSITACSMRRRLRSLANGSSPGCSSTAIVHPDWKRSSTRGSM